MERSHRAVTRPLGEYRDGRAARTGSCLPLRVKKIIGPSSMAAATAREVVSPTSTLPGSAAAWRRAATFIVSPVRRPSSGPSTAYATSPVLMPTRNCRSPSSSPSRAPRDSTAPMRASHCPDASLRVVVARPRHAEGRDRGVPDELLQPAAIAPDRLTDHREIGVVHRRDVLGVQLLGQGREAHQIGEEHGHDAPLERGSLHDPRL